MKEHRIKILIGLMTVALLGLVSFQYYLIQNLVQVEQEKFDRLVSEALNSVVMQIDRKETLNAVQAEMIQQIDTIHGQNGITIKKVTRNSSVEVEQAIKNRSGFEFITKSDGKQIPKSLVMLTEDEDGITQEEIFIDENQDTLFVSKFNLVTEVVTDLLTKNIDVETRLNSLPIDSLLSDELNDRGIELSHGFGVIDKERNPVILSDGSDSIRVINSNYGVRLFPLDITGKQNQLKVYFADTSSYILGNIAWMLGLSGLFLLTIGVIFFATIRMLLRQKKITEVKNDLINNITHEFKTPLSTISLAAEALNDPGFTKNENLLKKYTGMISTENRRLTSMVESLLNTAAFESGNYKLSLEKLKTHAIIKKVLKENYDLLESRDVEVKLKLDAVSDTVEADEFHISNVFKNLIENGVKYNERSPVIEVSTKNENGSILISIKDNGIGISKEHHKKIFDTFYRVPTGNVHNVKGNGVGLSYVHKMIAVHNGEVSLKSKFAEGSTFTIKLPVVKDE